jgi:Leucine-rich repeat (LRR) protein
MSITKSGCILAVAALVVAAAGCYDEPVSAEATVSAEKRIYLKNTDLGRLTVEAVYEKGLIYDSKWTNLSSRISLDKFKADGLKSVDYLNLDCNKLTNAAAIVEFPSLKWLRLNSNNLSSLPTNGFARLSKLRKIYLADNRFTAVPKQLEELPSLKEIDLSGNIGIKEIPDWMAKKQGFEDLSFSGTSIEKLPEDLSAWRSLRLLRLGELKMSGGEMKRIREALPDTTVVF